MESVSVEFGRIEKQKPLLVEQIIEKLKNNQIPKDLALKLQQSYKEQQSAIYKYSKAVDKKFKQTLDVDWIPDAFKGKEAYIDQIVCQHLLLQGKFEIASSFATETNTPLDNTIVSQCSDMFSISHALKEHDTAPAIAWCKLNRPRLGNSPIEFLLHRLEFLKALAVSPLFAVKYAQKHFEPFAVKHIKGLFSNSRNQKSLWRPALCQKAGKNRSSF
jgi:hypothetical protein